MSGGNVRRIWPPTSGGVRQSVSALEAGTRRVTVADAVALCKALEVDLHELLHGLDADDLRALGFGPGM